MAFAAQEHNQLYENGWVEFASMKDVIRQNWAIDAECRETTDIPSWPLGDFFLDMLKPGEVMFVTGLNGSGMTSVTLNTALSFAMQRPGAVVIHSLDQHPRYLASRLLNSAFGIPLSSLAGAESTDFCLPASAEQLLQLDISIDGKTYESPDAIETFYKAIGNLELIIVSDMDHFPFGSAKHETAAFLKAMAQDLDVPVLVACKAMLGTNSWPTMLDIRRQGVSWQDLDVIVSLYREFEWVGHRGYEFNGAEDAACKIILLKHRHRPTGMMPVKFSMRRLRFEKNGEFAPQAFDSCT